MSRIFVALAALALAILLVLALNGCFDREPPVDPVIPEETTPSQYDNTEPPREPVQYRNEETLPSTGGVLVG